MKERPFSELWKLFDRGDRQEITDKELRLMKKTGMQAEMYLASRGERLILHKIRMDNNTITDILEARRKFVQGDKKGGRRTL